MTVSYIGTAYHGWQVQKNANSVQSEVQNALEKVLGCRPALSGCSRTDSGVHARKYCCHFDSENPINTEKVIAGLNHFLPEDIGALALREVDGGFHARYSCKAKEYEYIIYNSYRRDPFLEGRSCRYPHALDENLMNRAAKAFLGTHDFFSFCSAGAKEGDKVRTVKSAAVERKGDVVIFRVRADGFLYNMVRIMVGTLIRVCEGKIKADKIGDIISAKDRSLAGPTAPAVGLYLKDIFYEEEEK